MKNNGFCFRVDVDTHDQTGKVIAVYFHIRKGKVARTKECQEGVAYADYNRSGKLLGVELLAPCSVGVLDKIASQKPAREFMRSSIPQGMLVTA